MRFPLILVMMITKFEKLELSIRLADKMDKMDRTWDWFTNSFINISIRKVRDLAGRVENETVRFLLRLSRRFLYYVVVLLIAFLLTRDDLTHDWVVELDTNMKVPEYSKHVQAYLSLFLIVILIFGV